MASANSIYLQLQKLTNQANQAEMQYNREEAATARSWQTEMSNTAHQREVKDLMAAGLNPTLAANNGAQSYTTSAASTSQDSGANALASAYGATTSAAATRAAAAASAAATKYAAQMNYAAAVESAKWNYKSTVYNTEHTKSGSIIGTISHYSDSIMKRLDENINRSQRQSLNKSASNLINGNSSLKSAFNSSKPITKSVFSTLSKKEISSIDSQLRIYGINRITNQIRFDYLRYLTSGSDYYMKAAFALR